MKTEIHNIEQIKKMINKPDILYVHCDEDDLMVEMPKVILKGIDEFIAVVNKLNPEIIFYEETYLSPNMFLIEEEDIEDSALYDLDEELAYDEVNEYHRRLFDVDFSSVFQITVSCLYQGANLVYSEIDRSIIEDNDIYPSGKVAMDCFAAKHIDKFNGPRFKSRKEILSEREELAKKIMEDIDFQKCTTKQKRKEWTLKYCAFHPDCISLFDEIVDDLHINDFIEDVWERLDKTPSKQLA